MSPVRRFAVGVTVAAVAILATAVPASAHDELVFSDPAQDAQLASPPESITMQFSGELLSLGDSMTGAVVLVVDQDGRDWVSGAPEVLRDTVTVAVEQGMPDAGYQVRWQVVSEDGHPIAGVIPFTIGDAAPMALGDDDQASTGQPGDDAASDDASAAASAPDQTAEETSGAIRLLLVGAGGAALAAAIFALYRFLRRPRTTAASPASGDSADTEL
nr:copper resistance protein CopC [uncultured Microbacterium sp.]